MERGATFARTTSTTKISQPRSLRLALCPSAFYLHMRCLTRTKGGNEGMQRMIGVKRCPESSKSHVTIFLTAHVQRKRGREIHGVLNIPPPSKVLYGKLGRITAWAPVPRGGTRGALHGGGRESFHNVLSWRATVLYCTVQYLACRADSAAAVKYLLAGIKYGTE
jgi:hypothetical protein